MSYRGIPQKKPVAPALIAAALALSVPVTVKFEGWRHRAYSDPVGITTICAGHTGGVKLGQYANDGTCFEFLNADQQQAAEGVAACVPGIVERRSTYAAAVDFSFNAGVNRFCTSSMARAFNAGRWTEGCKAFGLYRFAGGRVLPGLVKRRAAETQLCLRGAS